MIQPHKLISYNNFQDMGIQNEIRNYYQKQKQQNQNYFLDVLLDVDGPRIYEFQITHNIIKRVITLTAYDNTSDIEDGKKYYDLITKSISEVTGLEKYEENKAGERKFRLVDESPESIETQLFLWVRKYERLDFIRDINLVVR